MVTRILMFVKISLANYNEIMLFVNMTCIVITDKLYHFTKQKYNLIKLLNVWTLLSNSDYRYTVVCTFSLAFY